ncbi:myb protein-related [Anaeramoeba flamelloides]|uniref:Myb protein-related n=1 Tax=Anaeramoeba flamelloides TaxID=1746091 RepID=A0ABQ8YLW6_9EUKA|nr:myb protein-related [Anaeramoeba flamelloides]
MQNKSNSQTTIKKTNLFKNEFQAKKITKSKAIKRNKNKNKTRKPRANFVTQNGIRKGSWEKEEDELLYEAVQEIGPLAWTQVASFVPSRTPKQCRERWINQLNPELIHGNWTQKEDEIILQCRTSLGNKWATIQRKLPRRSANAIKNRYNSLATMQRKGKMLFVSSTTKNDQILDDTLIDIGESNKKCKPFIVEECISTTLKKDKGVVRKRTKTKKRIVLSPKSKLKKTLKYQKISEYNIEEELINKKSKMDVLLFVAEHYHKFQNEKSNPILLYLQQKYQN